jgi:hypothetical protein
MKQNFAAMILGTRENAAMKNSLRSSSREFLIFA